MVQKNDQSIIIEMWYQNKFDTKKLASQLNISYFTLIKTIKRHINNLTYDDIFKLYHDVDVDLKIISPKSKIYQQIVEDTNFLPENSPIRQRLYHLKNNTNTYPKCKCCDNSVKWDNTTKQYRKYCSIKCQSNDPDVQLQKKITNTTNRGVEFPAQSLSVKRKYKETMNKKYGINHVNQTKNTQNINDEKLLSNLYIQQHLSTFDIAKKHNVSQSYVSKLLQKYNIEPHSKSCFEQQIIDFINEEYNNKIILNSRKIIPPKEIDIFIPELNIAFECDGLFWHSENNGNKNKNYHLEKTLLCKQAGIYLIHIFENEWINKPEIVKSRIRSILKKNQTIFARKCKIKEISSKDAEIFYEENHIQGATKNQFNYSLIFDNKIVACMSFSKPRFSKKYDMELTRFCNAINYNVVGGASKLFNYFKTTNKIIKTIISYSDKRWSRGEMYKKLYFNYSHTSAPNYWYFKYPSTKLYSRIYFQKHKLSSILNNFNNSMTEWENMINNGYDRIWDCGNDVWIWNRN